MFKTILVAIDGSTGNERILLFAEHLARIEHGELILLHAFQPPAEYDWTDSYAALRAQFEAVAGEVVRDAQEVLQAAGLEALADIRQGPADEAVLAAARTHEADLIVMGGRAGARAGGDLFLGSVAAQVLRGATCPVLVVP